MNNDLPVDIQNLLNNFTTEKIRNYLKEREDTNTYYCLVFDCMSFDTREEAEEAARDLLDEDLFPMDSFVIEHHYEDILHFKKNIELEK